MSSTEAGDVIDVDNSLKGSADVLTAGQNDRVMSAVKEASASLVHNLTQEGSQSFRHALFALISSVDLSFIWWKVCIVIAETLEAKKVCYCLYCFL